MTESWNTLLKFKECVGLWVDQHQILACLLIFVIGIPVCEGLLLLFMLIFPKAERAEIISRAISEWYPHGGW